MGVCDILLLKFLPPPTRLCIGFFCGASIMLALAAARETGWIQWPFVIAIGILGCVVGFYGSGFLL